MNGIVEVFSACSRALSSSIDAQLTSFLFMISIPHIQFTKLMVQAREHPDHQRGWGYLDLVAGTRTLVLVEALPPQLSVAESRSVIYSSPRTYLRCISEAMSGEKRAAPSIRGSRGSMS